jgi:hypothetical protein
LVNGSYLSEFSINSEADTCLILLSLSVTTTAPEFVMAYSLSPPFLVTYSYALSYSFLLKSADLIAYRLDK